MKGRGFSFLLLLIAMAVALLLAAKAWRTVTPTASQIVNPGSGDAVADHGDEKAGEAVRSGTLPDLNDMKQRTNTHTQNVQEALEEAH